MGKKSVVVLLLLFMSMGVCAQDVFDEADLLQRFLNHRRFEQLLHLGNTQKNAAQTVDPFLQNPEISVGYEQPFSSDGTYSAKLLGVGMNFDLSGSYFNKKETAIFRENLVKYSQKQRRFNLVSQFRSLVNSFYFTRKKHIIMHRMHKKIKRLLQDLDGLVAGKHRSLFDKKRMNSLFLLHSVRLDRAGSELSALREELQFYTDTDVEEIILSACRIESVDQLLHKSSSNNQLVKQFEEKVAIAEMNLKQAKKSWIPELGVEFGLLTEKTPSVDSEYGFEVGMSIELPIFNQQTKSTRDKAAEKLAIEFKKEEIKLEMKAQLRSKYRKIKELTARRKRFSFSTKELIDSAFTLYREGESTIGDLISTISESEEMLLVTVELDEEIRTEILELYQIAGYFNDKEINNMIFEVEK